MVRRAKLEGPCRHVPHMEGERNEASRTTPRKEAIGR
jgi:hypothetical protein